MKRRELAAIKSFREDPSLIKTSNKSENLSEDETTYKFFSSLVGEHGQELQWQPRVEHLPKG
jgi:hypothetical protein